MSNLPFVYKITEKAQFNQLHDHMNRVQCFSRGQSAFSPFYRAETAMLNVLLSHGLLLVEHFWTGPRPISLNKYRLTWWRHQMDTFSESLALCAGNSPHKSQWRKALMFSLICAWINGWVNNGKDGDLRRHHALYDVIVMENYFRKEKVDHRSTQRTCFKPCCSPSI